MEQTESDQGEWGGGQWWEEEEGTRQRASMNDPRTWTTAWGLTVGGVGWTEEGDGGKIGTTVIEYQ